MAFTRKVLPVDSGVGELRYPGFSGSVRYDIKGEPAKLKLGPLRLQGSLTGDPQAMAEAFRKGEAVLVLAGGATYRLTLVGHSAGGEVAYFELRV